VATEKSVKRPSAAADWGYINCLLLSFNPGLTYVVEIFRRIPPVYVNNLLVHITKTSHRARQMSRRGHR